MVYWVWGAHGKHFKLDYETSSRTLDTSDGINSEDSLLVHPVVSSGLHESFIISCVLYDDIWFDVQKACNHSLLLCHKRNKLAANYIIFSGPCRWQVHLVGPHVYCFSPSIKSWSSSITTQICGVCSFSVYPPYVWCIPLQCSVHSSFTQWTGTN